METKIIPITLLTGYLGAGKTTLLNYVLNNQQGYRVAVIVNDIGEVNVDANLIGQGGVVSEGDDSLVPLQNGCICCTLKQDLMKQIASLAASNKFDYIMIEASGICEPVPIVQTIQALADATKQYKLPTTVRLDNVVSVVDACRLVDEFGSGRELLKTEIEEEDIENLIIQQIEFCNKIIVNKANSVSKEELKEVEQVVKALQPEAEIIEADYGKVDLAKILNTQAFDFDKASMSAAWIKELNAGAEDEEDDDDEHSHEENEHDEHHHHHGEGEVLEYGIGTFVYQVRKPLNKLKFKKFVENFPKSIIRCKGVVWYSDDEENMHMFEQAGKQTNSMNVGPWVVSLPKQQQERILAENADIRADWREDVGDRIVKLVFIGKNMDQDSIINSLNNCL